MYLISYINKQYESVPVAISSTQGSAQSVIRRLQAAADKTTGYVYYNGMCVDTLNMETEYIPEYTEDYLHERVRMS